MPDQDNSDNDNSDKDKRTGTGAVDPVVELEPDAVRIAEHREFGTQLVEMMVQSLNIKKDTQTS